MGAEESTLAGDNNSSNILKIVVVGPKNGEDCYSELAYLPKATKIIATGNTYAELTENGCDISEGNVIMNLRGNKRTLPDIILGMPQLEWFHSCVAGLDNSLCSELIDNDNIVVTNCKGIFSYSLAEYCMGMFLHFAKEVPRLMVNKEKCQWDRFKVRDLKGSTLGVIGYGDIGQACGRLGMYMQCAHAFVYCVLQSDKV